MKTIILLKIGQKFISLKHSLLKISTKLWPSIFDFFKFSPRCYAKSETTRITDFIVEIPHHLNFIPKANRPKILPVRLKIEKAHIWFKAISGYRLVWRHPNYTLRYAGYSHQRSFPQNISFLKYRQNSFFDARITNLSMRKPLNENYNPNKNRSKFLTRSAENGKGP